MRRWLLTLIVLWTTALVGTAVRADINVPVNELKLTAASGGHYPLRYGQSDTASDNVPFPGNWFEVIPWCFKKGSTVRFGFKFIDDPSHGPTGYPMGYAFLVRLIRADTLDVVWEVIRGIEPYTTDPFSIDLPVLPDEINLYYMDIRLDGYYLINGVWTLNTSIPLLTNKVYGVLDQPVSPMSPAWTTMLDYSCSWARGTNNFDDAAQKICFGVFFQRNPGGGFYYPDDTRTRWVDFEEYDGNPTIPPTFKLKAVLDRWSANKLLRGNCRDVSCLTMIALCSVGMDFSTRELTGTLFQTSFPNCDSNKCPRDPNTGNYVPHFHTNSICAIGSDPTIDSVYDWWPWGWHQVCVRTGAADPPSNVPGIWDPTEAQRENLNGNGYRNPPAHHLNHLWPQKDYWQKWFAPESKWLGLVNQPTQDVNDPKLGGSPRNLGTWKCRVDTGVWNPAGEPLP
jgi:hypothetical protein